MSKRLSDEDIERIAARVAEKIGTPVVIQTRPYVDIRPGWTPPSMPAYKPLEIWC